MDYNNKSDHSFNKQLCAGCLVSDVFPEVTDSLGCSQYQIISPRDATKNDQFPARIPVKFLNGCNNDNYCYLKKIDLTRMETFI